MKYLDTKKSSLEDSVIRVMMGEKKLDPVNPDAVKKKFDDRKDKDIDNDGDVDSTDKYLHKRRKAISKAVKNEGTWSLPDTPKLKMGLKKVMKDPIPFGKNGDEAVTRIEPYIGDDELYDDLYDLSRKNPNNDARPVIRKAMKRLGIKEGLDKDDEGTVKKVVQKLKKASQAHANHSKTLTKDLQDEKDLDEKRVTSTAFRKKIAGVNPMDKKDIERMVKDRKYKGNTSALMKDVKKRFPDEYESNIVQDMMKKHAEMNEHSLDENFRNLAMMGIGTETKKGAKVGQSMDYYLPKTGDKSTGKIMRVSKDGYEIKNDGDLTPRMKGKRHKFKFYDPTSDKTSVRGMRKEVYDIGNDYAKHTLRVTPGQSESDVDEMLGIMQKKSVSMREALAKVWGLDEGKSPFDKKEEKKEDKNSKKTMTGKEQTSVEVDPELNEGKIEKKKISERLGKNYKFNKNFLFDDKKDTPMSVFKTMGNRPGGADYNQTELADYLAQKSGKDFKDIYFDDIELVYVNKTVGTMKQPIAKLIDVLKKAR